MLARSPEHLCEGGDESLKYLEQVVPPSGNQLVQLYMTSDSLPVNRSPVIFHIFVSPYFISKM